MTQYVQALTIAGHDSDGSAGMPADLARAVAACTGRKTADLFSEGDLADIAERVSFGWDPEVDGPLPDVD